MTSYLINIIDSTSSWLTSCTLAMMKLDYKLFIDATTDNKISGLTASVVVDQERRSRGDKYIFQKGLN
ncbi:hypothetical protein VI08_06655 [Luteibacter yeojuensis]|uniref:Uncharacterized protein n=1 Tax=Luteibacter yeojuensis TaxID=345309 RepID=A0A0F3L006_9GAMM|nr:hypothetical protein VI08_06655 [Luteibacter yeojuensis]